MRQHTLLGARMLEELDAYRDEDFVRVAYQICRWHHERYEGHRLPGPAGWRTDPHCGTGGRPCGCLRNADYWQRVSRRYPAWSEVQIRSDSARPGRSIRCCWTACGRSRTRSTMPCVVGRRPYKSDRRAALTGKALRFLLCPDAKNESPVLARRRRLCYTVKNTVRNLQKTGGDQFPNICIGLCAARRRLCWRSAVRLWCWSRRLRQPPLWVARTRPLSCPRRKLLAWLFGTSDTITMPYLNIRGKGLQRNVTLNLVDCLVGITYTELGSIGSYVSASAAQQAWKAQAVAIHSYLEYHKQYGSSANALIYTPVDHLVPLALGSHPQGGGTGEKSVPLPTTAASATPCGRPVRAITPRLPWCRHLLQPGCMGHRCAVSAERRKPL